MGQKNTGQERPSDKTPAKGRRRPGPRPALDVDKVVRAAIEIADVEGLAAVSMASVANRLGFTPMSLYRHVSNKDELLTLMRQTAIGVPDLPVADGWRDGLHAWTQMYVSRALQHPWVVEIPVEGPPSDPRSLLWLEAALRAMDGLPLSEGTKVNVVLALLLVANGTASLILGLRQGALQDEDGSQPRYDLDIRTSAETGDFPHLAQALRAGVFDVPARPGDQGMDENLSFSVNLILDGVETLVRQE